MEKKKDFLKTAITRGMKNEKVLLGLLGVVLLIVIMMPVNDAPYDESVTQPQETVNESSCYTWYEQYLEERLKNLLSKTCNIGNAEVMVTLKNTVEKVLETEGRNDDKTVVRQEESNKKMPYVVQEKLPEVAGVVIVAQNGDNPVIISEITQAVEALLSVSAHRIKVLKMK